MLRRLRSLYVVPMLAILLAGLFGAPNVFAQYAPGGAMLKGIAKSQDGKPMAGVTVTVRGENKSFATSVFTDESGTYIFPRLEKGKYNLWAQAVGFAEAKTTVNVADGQTQQVAALELKPLKDFQSQLSANEWLSSLPETQPGDLRMKAILATNCTGCHQVGFPLQNQFDAKGWAAVINVMSRIGPTGVVAENAKPNELLLAYKEEVSNYLERVRGPGSPLLTPKVLPRPTGDAAKVVITEFDLPRPEAPQSLLKFNGSDWSDGLPSTYAGRAAHDLTLDNNGNIYWADDVVPERTIGKLDPKTGKVTTYKLNAEDSKAVGTHSIITDPQGNLWATNQTEGTFTMFDPKTETFHRYPRPDSVPQRTGGTMAMDSKGHLWSPSGPGAIELEPETGKYIWYKAVTPGGTYGIAVDAEDKAWFTEPGIDTIGVVDASGKVSEVVLPPSKSELGNDRDRELISAMWVGPNRFGPNNATPFQKGPRRLWADPKGNYVWVAEFFGDQLARIDIHTREVKEYPFPHRYSQPYAINVDKNHNVWIDMLDQDRVAKFDPTTEQFTEYQMPTRGTESRHILPDNSTDPPTIYVPYDRTNKIARIQFRTNSDLQSK